MLFNVAFERLYLYMYTFLRQGLTLKARLTLNS